MRLLLDVRKDAVIVPGAAVQRGPQGTFVYVVKADQTVEVRPVDRRPDDRRRRRDRSGARRRASVVVVDGVDKLRAGSAVQRAGAGRRSAGAAAGA